jgi:hypothetical protein
MIHALLARLAEVERVLKLALRRIDYLEARLRAAEQKTRELGT